MSIEQIEIDSVDLSNKLSTFEIAKLCLNITGYFLDSMIMLNVPRLSNRKYLSSMETYFKILGDLLTGLMKLIRVSPCRITEREMELMIFRTRYNEDKLKVEFITTKVNNGVVSQLHPFIILDLLILLARECILALAIRIDNHVPLVSRYIGYIESALVPLVDSCVSTIMPEPLDNHKFELTTVFVKVKINR